MIRAIATLLALSLTACATKSTPPVAFPALAPLPASVMEVCPPAERLSGSNLGDLVIADIDLAVAYAECQARHAAAVAAYNKARRLVAEASAKVDP